MKVLYPDSDQPSRKYKFELGDFVSISLTKKSRTPYTILSSFMLGNAAKDDLENLTYGGMVLNEDY
ncbi:hypothetical protein D3C78_1818780 [compost metagenome]